MIWLEHLPQAALSYFNQTGELSLMVMPSGPGPVPTEHSRELIDIYGCEYFAVLVQLSLSVVSLLSLPLETTETWRE